MVSTDTLSCQDLPAAVSVRENERVSQIGAGCAPHWHQPTDVFVTFSEADFKELFELFSSCSTQELSGVYDPSSTAYFLNTKLDEEYELAQSKREFAIDAIRAVLGFLSRRGYRLEKDGEFVALPTVDDLFG